MEIRAATTVDRERLMDIDATIESTRYLHVERAGEGLAMSWRLEERPLREKLVQPNPVDDEMLFALRQIAGGAEEGLALVAEHDGALVAVVAARIDPALGTLKIVDLRVDYDYRRQGLGSALLFRAIQEARERELRAVMAEARANNIIANEFLLKAGFELGGLDTHLHSNHDLVKEAVTLFWYAPLA